MLVARPAHCHHRGAHFGRGFGGAVAEICMDGGVVPAAFRRLGLREEFSSIVGSQDYLRRVYGLDEGAIVAAVERVLGGASESWQEGR